MSTQAERSEIAVLQTQMKTVQSDVSEVKGDVKGIRAMLETLSQSFVSQKQFDDYKKDMDSKFKQLNKNKWVAVVASTLITAIISALVYLAFGVHRG